MDGEGALRWIWIWMAVDESRILLQSDWNGYGFWMAMDESIRTERVDVMWCRLWNRMRRISFVIGILEFCNIFGFYVVPEFSSYSRPETTEI